MELSGLKHKFNKVIHNKTIINGSLFSLFSFFGQGMSFVLLILLANYIQPKEYGVLSLFTTVVTFAGFIIAFSTRGYPGVTYFKKKVEEFKQDFTAVIVLGLITFIILALPVVLFGNILGEMLGLSKQLLWYVLIISFFSLIYLLQQDYLRIKEKVTLYGFFNCGNAILNFALSILLVITFNQNWMGRVNAMLICSIVFGFFSCFYIYRHDLIRVRVPQKVYKDALGWGIPMIPHAASGWIRQGLDRYIINYYHSIYDVGIFSFALNLSNIIVMIGSAFNSTNSVTLFQVLSDQTLTNDQKKKKLSSQTRYIIVIYIISTVIVLLSMTILTMFALPKYKESTPLMWILAINGLGNSVYFLYCNYLFYYNDTKILMYFTFSTSVIHLLLSLAFTRFSLYCTALVYGVMMIVMMSLTIWRAKRLIKLNLI